MVKLLSKLILRAIPKLTFINEPSFVRVDQALSLQKQMHLLKRVSSVQHTIQFDHRRLVDTHLVAHLKVNQKRQKLCGPVLPPFNVQEVFEARFHRRSECRTVAKAPLDNLACFLTEATHLLDCLDQLSLATFLPD